MLINEVLLKQGRIHGNPVADGWAGAVLQKTFGIQKCDGRTDGTTDTARCRVACPRLRYEKSKFLIIPKKIQELRS